MIRLQIENERLKRARTSEPESPCSTKLPKNAEPAPEKPANPAEAPMPRKETMAHPNKKAPAIDPSKLETQIEEPMELEEEEEEEEETDEHEEGSWKTPEDEKDQEEGLDGEPYDEEDEVAVDSESEKTAADQELEAEEERAVEAITRLEMEAQAARVRLQELRDRVKVEPKTCPEPSPKPLSALAMALKKGAEEHRLLKRGEASSHLTLASTTASMASTKVLGADNLHPSNPAALNTEPAADVASIAGNQAADPATINTSTHRKEWAKLERMMNSKGSDFPHMAQLFNGRQAANWVHSASGFPFINM